MPNESIVEGTQMTARPKCERCMDGRVLDAVNDETVAPYPCPDCVPMTACTPDTNDPWMEKIEPWLFAQPLDGLVTTARALTEAVGLSPDALDHQHGVRASAVLRRLGWMLVRRRYNGHLRRFWVPRLVL